MIQVFKKKFITLLLLASLSPTNCHAESCVILLHGLARTAASMNKLMKQLQTSGFHVLNLDYPSRKKTVEILAENVITRGLAGCQRARAYPVNFVTHSLGGILVRQYYSQHSSVGLGRVVMLGPPNKGSEVVDAIKHLPGFELLNGPAGMQLGTGEFELPKSLCPVNFELGVIAGTQSINLILSLYLPNPDDGKVSMESTRVEGMCGFVALPVTHPFIMKNEQVIKETIAFLKTGRFVSEHAHSSC